MKDETDCRLGIALFLTALGVVVAVALFEAQPRSVTLAIGRFVGTDLDSSECYFQIGAAMLALHPKGEPCVLARELVGHTGRLIFVPD